MKRDELLEKVAPCSLMCHTCGAYDKGVICQNAKELVYYMQGVSEFYKKHSSPALEPFNQFYAELKNYSEGGCSGCRNPEHNGCSIKGCFILECTKKHNIDFCGECNEFPCEKVKTIFENEVYSQWLNGNTEIKNDGIEKFWESNCTKPHYKAYIK